ncbi:T9SS type A sorting domain-containing protein [Bizionia sp.]|uniref:T9SS type A sorting domain-containing protein n=1 Tax=Bizionia sp. TaxID=1954480 RepID=UPI003A9156EF
MKKILLFTLLPLFTYGQWTQIGQDIDGEAANDGSGIYTDLNGDGNIVAIGATNNNNNAGHVRVYENFDGTWIQIGNDIDGVNTANNSGRHLSLNNNGQIVAIGAALFGQINNPSVGHVRVFENISGDWIQIGEDLIGENQDDQSGSSVSLNNDGDIVAIGAEYNNLNRGHVRVYQNINGSWVQLGSDIDGEGIGDRSGCSVSLNGDGTILAIGAESNDGEAGFDTGHVRIYEYLSNNWQQIGTDIEGEGFGDESGTSISLNDEGNIVAIGAGFNDNPNGNNAGHVRVYQNFAGVWTQIGSDIDGEAENDFSGGSVSINSAGDIVAIGAANNDGTGFNAGHARIYKYESVDWVQVDADIDAEAERDGFGRSVSLNNSGNIVAVGAIYNEGVNGINSGHVRVFNNTLLSIEDNSPVSKITLYPNPSKGYSVIEFEYIQPIINLEIFDTLGKLIDSKSYFNTCKIKLNTQSYSKGHYLISVSSKEGLTNRLKLLVQ